jgi:hypothetical protein
LVQTLQAVADELKAIRLALEKKTDLKTTQG